MREPLLTRAKRRIGILPKVAAVKPQEPQAAETAPDPIAERVDALEAAFDRVFADRERSAEMIAEQNRRIQEQDGHIARLQADKAEQGQQNIKLAQQISHVQGQHDAFVHEADRSRKEQGQRIGDLDHRVAALTKEAELVPPLREQVTKLQLLLNLYHIWRERIVALLTEHHIAAPDPPVVDFERIEAQSRKLSQVEGGRE